MSTGQHGHDGNLAGCVDLLPTMVQVRVLAHCKSFRKCGLLLGAKLGEATS